MPDKLTDSERTAIDSAVKAGKVTVLPPAKEIGDSEGDFRFEVRVKNARILRAMRAAGIESAAELSRRSGVDQSFIGQVLAMKVSPLKMVNGQSIATWKDKIDRLSTALGVAPEDLFSENQKYRTLKQNKINFDVSEAEISMMLDNIESRTPEEIAIEDEARLLVRSALEELPERASTVIRQLVFDGHTLEEVAAKQKVTKERIRQIEIRGFRQLKHPNRTAIRAAVGAFPSVLMPLKP